MRKFKLLLILLCTTNMFAQDVIITNDDNMFKAYNVEIGKNAIFYQAEDNEDAPIQKIAKSDVFIIKKADGTKIDPNEIKEEQPKQVMEVKSNSDNSVVDYTPSEEEIRLADERNKEMIKEWNDAPLRIDYVLDKKGNKKKDKMYNRLISYGVTEDSRLCDAYISIKCFSCYAHAYFRDSFFSESWTDNFRCVGVSVTNTSDKFIYVDMLNCYLTTGGKVKDVMYDATVTTTTDASAVGVGVGIIGGASANATTKSYSQSRIIPIPPQTTVTLPYYLKHPSFNFASSIWDDGIKCDSIGQVRVYRDDPQLMHTSVMISYSFNENGANLHTVKTTFYAQKLIQLGKENDRRMVAEDSRNGLYDIIPYEWRDIINGKVVYVK